MWIWLYTLKKAEQEIGKLNKFVEMFDVSAIKGERALRALSMWNHFYHGSFLMRYHDDLVACDEYL